MITGVSHLSAGRPSVDASLIANSSSPAPETHLLAKQHLLNGESNNNADGQHSDVNE